MLVKRLKAKQPAKSSPRSAAAKTRKAKTLRPEFSPEEVTSLEQQVARHQQSESAWQRLTSPPEEKSGWTDEVEEHLLHKTEQHAHAERRWKYFSK